MGATGGPLQEIAIRGRTFPVAADTEANRNLGGMSNEVSPNGDGRTGAVIQEVMKWSVKSVNVRIDDDRGDQEFLQARADSAELVPIEVTFPRGVVYAGKGTIEGEIEFNSKQAVATITLAGPGKLEQQ